MTCSHCGIALGPGAKFCPACGQAVAVATVATLGADPHIGREIAGRYRIVEKLGEGGMGAVYRGEQIALARPVAIKLLRGELLHSATLARRFHAEAAAVAKLSHPNTVNIFDFGDDHGALFIAMEYVDGRSLRAVLRNEAPLPPARALAIAQQIAASLSDAHAHDIVHRDLKPDNVMLQDRGRQRDRVRVLDFGIAKLRDDSRASQAITQAGDMLGTPQYMAPEQIRSELIDGRTDVYALGCIIYEMVTARMPFEAPAITAMLAKHLTENVVPPSVRRPDLALPPAIDQLVLAAMAKDPRARPPTMDAFGEQIAALLATLPPPRGPITARDSPVPGGYGLPASTPQRLEPTPATAPQRPRGTNVVPIVIAIGTLALAGIGVWAATRDHAKAVADPWGGEAGPRASNAPAQAHARCDDQRIAVVRGVELCLPSTFSVAASGGMVRANNVKLGVTAFPITTPSDEPSALAADYARTANMTLDLVQEIKVDGGERPFARFRGIVGSAEVTDFAVAYLGTTYRVAVVVRVMSIDAGDKDVTDFVADLFDRRVLLPP